MKSILFVVDSLNIGGAEKSLISLLNNIDFQKYSISLLVLSKNYTLLNHVPDKVHILQIPGFIKHLYKPLLLNIKDFRIFINRIIFSIKLRINKNMTSTNNYLYWKTFSPFFYNLNQNYDVAIGWGQGMPIFFILDKVKADKKIGWFNAEYPIELKLLSNFNKYFNQLDYVVAVSDILKEKLKKEISICNNKIKTIYDIIDDKFIISLSNQSIPFIFPNTKIKLLTIARFDKRKGLELAIETAKILKDELDYVWYIIGDGSEKAILKRKIIKYNLEDKFILLGELENPYPYLKSIDMYIQPSLSEGFCLTLSEAKILNKPIVTTDFPTAYIQIKEGSTGLISRKEPRDMANKIKSLATDQNLQIKFIENLSKETKGNKKEIYKFYSLIN